MIWAVTFGHKSSPADDSVTQEAPVSLCSPCLSVNRGRGGGSFIPRIPSGIMQLCFTRSPAEIFMGLCERLKKSPGGANVLPAKTS